MVVQGAITINECELLSLIMQVQWSEYVTHMGEIRNAYKIWSENLNKRAHFRDIGIDERIILECILHKQSRKVWTR
jgi:hypothetical protein